MTLFGYWRSSSAWRVRIALELKGLAYTNRPVNLLEAEHLGDEHRARNPLGQVPVLQLDDGTCLTQSMAILDFLENTHPEPSLIPSEAKDRAQVLALAEIVNSGIQPLQNLAVLKRVTALGSDRTAWGREVIASGLASLQAAASSHAGDFLFGDSPTLADVLLIPQLYNARRFAVDLQALDTLTAIEARCAALPAFERAHPDQQPDARVNP